ncbi:phage tail protein [Endothiovibrio diazotrophicus]
MADPFLAEIRILPYYFAPEDWAYCEGQIYPIQQNPALYSLLGITWGGDGRSTFALPNMLGRVPMGNGTGPGLTPRIQGQTGGYSEIQLTTGQIPSHDHDVNVRKGPGESTNPEGLYPAFNTEVYPNATLCYEAPDGTDYVNMAPQQVSVTGASEGHVNTQPWLAVNFCICTDGYYPPRS